MTLILPGHRLDAKQAGIYNVFCLNRRFYTRRPDLRPYFEEGWTLLARQSGKGGYGPLRRLFQAVRALSWQWNEPWSFTTSTGASFHLLRDTDARWKHELRCELRSMVWRESSLLKRKDMEGLERIDYEATVALLRKQKCYNGQTRKRRKQPEAALSPLLVTHLRTLLTGCVQSRERLLLGKKARNMLCPHCQSEPETVTHILWHCPAWQDQRLQILSKFSLDFLLALPECTKQCGIVLTDTPVGDRQSFAVLLKKTQEARDAERKLRGQAWLDSQAGETGADASARPSSCTLPLHIQANPGLAEGPRLFPAYPWSYEADNTVTETVFYGRIPANWRRFASNAEWTFDLQLFPALVWYFRKLKWPSLADQHSISWLELAIDFMAATHVKLCQPNDDAGEHTAESQARLFAAATKRMALICQDSVAPGIEAKALRSASHVPSLTALDLGRAAGLQCRPCLLRPNFVHKQLLQAALERQLQSNTFFADL